MRHKDKETIDFPSTIVEVFFLRLPYHIPGCRCEALSGQPPVLFQCTGQSLQATPVSCRVGRSRILSGCDCLNLHSSRLKLSPSLATHPHDHPSRRAVPSKLSLIIIFSCASWLLFANRFQIRESIQRSVNFGASPPCFHASVRLPLAFSRCWPSQHCFSLNELG